MENWKRLFLILLGKEKQRRILIIDPDFQWRFINLNLITSILMIAVFFSACFYFLNSIEMSAGNLDVPYNKTFQNFIHSQRIQLVFISLAAGFFVFLIHFVSSLFFSHKVAGPIFRTKKYLQEYKKAQANAPLQFRDGDYFSDLAQELNKFIDEHLTQH